MPASKIHRIVAITEEEGEIEVSPGLKLVRDGFSPTKVEQAMLDQVLRNNKDIIGSEPGLTNYQSILGTIVPCGITLTVFLLDGKTRYELKLISS